MKKKVYALCYEHEDHEMKGILGVFDYKNHCDSHLAYELIKEPLGWPQSDNETEDYWEVADKIANGQNCELYGYEFFFKEVNYFG